MTENQKLREALHDAATSLETISRLAGKAVYQNGDFTHMGTFADVRGYATSRACVARQALDLPTAEVMTNGLTQAETDASASVSGLTAAPAGDLPELPDHYGLFNINGPDGHRIKGYTADQMRAYARAALSAGDAVDAQRTPQPHAVITGKLGTLCSFNSSELRKGDPIYTAAQIDAAMRKGQL